MPAERIAENLAYINWTLLTGLAIGTFAAVVLARLRTTATRGYLVFTAGCALAFGVLAFLSDQGLPARESVLIGNDLPRRASLALFDGLAAVSVVVLARRGSIRWLGVASVAAGLATWLFGALGWTATPTAGALLFLQLVVLGAATGGVFAAMVLGHWYLVTPKLPEAPLVLLARLLLGVLVVQLVLFVAWAAVGAGAPGGEAEPGFGVLTGPWALFAWLRLVVGLGFPIVVSWAAVQTARTRSMESATGLLYINVGTIAAGTILAAGLYFGAGILA